MSKNLLQDMVKIKNPNREAEILSREEVRVEKTRAKNPGRSVSSRGAGRQTNKSRYKLWFVAIISLIFFLFALSYLFLKVEVTVKPKMQDVILNENLSASKDANAEALPFDLIVISGEENKIIQTTEEKDIARKAQGVVLIYNAFSSASQLLSIDTRLEGSNGKIYKTKKQIVVPGMKGSIPGSIEVGIYAAEAGDAYNSGPLDFTIFGFKGTPKYSKFYARSDVNDAATAGAISGGFEGKFPFISDNQKISETNNLKTTLRIKLLNKAMDQIPKGLVLFKDAVFLDTNENSVSITSSEGNKLSLKLKGTLYGFLFNESKLAKKIAQENIEKYDNSEVFISNIQSLTFSLPNKDSISFGDAKNLNFNLSGSAKIVWKLDVNKLIIDLLGKSKKDFNRILLQYSSIDSADLEINPFWKMSFPDKIKDIKVIVNYPK